MHRGVFVHSRPTSSLHLPRGLKQQVIPMLRKEHGVQDDITFVGPAETEIFGVSPWDNKESAMPTTAGRTRK